MPDRPGDAGVGGRGARTLGLGLGVPPLRLRSLSTHCADTHPTSRWPQPGSCKEPVFPNLEVPNRLVRNQAHTQLSPDLYHTNEPSGIFQRDVLEVSGLLSSASAYLHFPIFGPHTRPLPSLEDRTHTYTHRHTSLCLRGILDLPSGDSSPLPHFPRLRLLRLTNLWLFQSLKGLETTSHTPCVPCLTPEPLPSYPKQSSCLWQQGRWLCLVHASSLSIHEMNEGLLSSIKPGSFPLLHTEHLPDAGGRCAGF